MMSLAFSRSSRSSSADSSGGQGSDTALCVETAGADGAGVERARAGVATSAPPAVWAVACSLGGLGLLPMVMARIRTWGKPIYLTYITYSRTLGNVNFYKRKFNHKGHKVLRQRNTKVSEGP